MLTKIAIDYLIELNKNYIFWAALSAWFIAQTIKVVSGVFREKRFDFRWFGETGGMPSSHSASVSSLAASIGITYGFDSVLFAIVITFAIIVICDAQGARMATGKQAEVLNKMLKDVYWKNRIEEDKLKELVGHTPIEVFAGIFLGILVSLLFYR